MPFLSRGVRSNPIGLAADDGRQAPTFEELSRGSEEVARRLRTLGVGPGSRVALAGNLNVDVLTALHGIWKAGSTFVPLNPQWSGEETGRALRTSDPSLLLVGQGAGRVIQADSTPKVYGLGPSAYPGAPLLSEVELSTGPLAGLSPGDEAALLFTSGTGGSPRLVGITVGNLMASAEGAQESLDLAPSDRWLGSLSLAHIGGVALVTRAAVLGSGLILRGPFETETFLSLMENGTVTHASLVPTMLHRALEIWGKKRAPRSLRCLLIGGAPAREPLIRAALEAGFPLALTYGLTEASSQVATASPVLVRTKPGTVGPPLPGVAVRITEAGDLLVRGPTVAPGQAQSDGWLHTGDLAREDGDGHLWITGRRSDRIISGGVNVDPSEVEGVLQTHPQVSEAVVVGLPDREWGERVVAAIVCDSPGPAMEGALEELTRRTFSPAKRPRTFRFLDSIPRNPNGKVDRKKVRTLFL